MKKVKIITIILAIVLVTLIAFGGIYVKTQNRMENKVKDYTLGSALYGERVIELKVSDNAKESATVSGYETVKKTIEKRLDNLGAQDYTVSLNKENGEIIVELAEDNLTDTYAHFLIADGKVQIKEKDAENILLSDSMIEKAKYSYTTDADGKYQVFMELYLTKEGQAKIEEIKNNYAIFADEIKEIEAKTSDTENKDENAENTEGTQAEETQTEETKKIAKLTIAGSEYDISSVEKNIIKANIGSATSNTTYVNNYINVALEAALLINSGKYPVEYEMEDNNLIFSNITEKQLIYFEIAVAIVMVIVTIILTIKYKTKGLLAGIASIGFISILSILLRYTNVNISVEGICGILLVIIINYIIEQKMLEEDLEIKEVILDLAPVIIVALVFCFSRWIKLSSFGMVMFWGLALIGLYNITVTKTLLKLKESK